MGTAWYRTRHGPRYGRVVWGAEAPEAARSPATRATREELALRGGDAFGAAARAAFPGHLHGGGNDAGTTVWMALAQHLALFTNTTVRGYATRGHPVYAPIAVGDARYNRATFYPASRLHTGWISDPARLSTNASLGRLTLNMFWGGNCQKYFRRTQPDAVGADYVSLAARYVSLSNQRRLAAALGMFDSEATYRSGAGEALEGRDAIADMMHAFFARYRWDGARHRAWAVDEGGYRLVGEREVAFDFVMRASDTSAQGGGKRVERRGTERVRFGVGGSDTKHTSGLVGFVQDGMPLITHVEVTVHDDAT